NTPRLRATCPKCQVQSDFVEKQVVTYFHLYWIPLFPIGRGLKFIECQYCHGQFELSLDELRAREEAAAQQQHAEAAAAAAHQQRQVAEAGTPRRAWGGA